MSSTPPSSLIDLDMRSLLDMENPYQSAEDLCGDAVDGGPAEILVDFCLQLRINPKTRRQNFSNNFKEEWQHRGRKQWLGWLIPTIFMLCCSLLKLSHPGTPCASVPQETSRVSKRVRVVATWVDISE